MLWLGETFIRIGYKLGGQCWHDSSWQSGKMSGTRLSYDLIEGIRDGKLTPQQAIDFLDLTVGSVDCICQRGKGDD